MTRRGLLLLILLLAGCTATAPVARTGLSGGTRLGAQPADEDDGMPVTLSVDLQVRARSVQTLPASWDAATLRLEHASAMAQALSRTLAKGSGLVASGSAYVASSSFGALRPRSGYVLTVDLWNGGANATLVAEKQVTVSLVAGNNAISVPLVVYPALGLTGFSPSSASPGSTVTLSGQGFSVLPSLTQVSLGTAGDMQTLTPTSLASTSLSAVLPTSVSPGAKTWQVQVGSSLAARTGFTVLGTSGALLEASTAATQQQDPSIAFGGGQYLAAWTDSRAATGAGIYAVRMAADGSVTGSELTIANLAAQSSKPAIAHDATNDRFLVVFESNGSILGQLVNANGTLLGGTITLAATTGGRSDAKVAFDATNGQYLVTWTDTRAGTSQIYGQRLSAAGALLGGNVSIVSVTGVAQSRGHVAYSSTANKFLVVNTSQASPMRIVGRVVNPDGTFGTGVVTLGSGSGNQVDPAVAADPVSGDFFVVWDSAITGFRDSVLGQRVTAAGALVGGTVTVSAFNSLKEAPHVGYESSCGTFLVTWGDSRASDTDLYAAHVGLGGALWGTEFPVRAGANSQTKGEVAVDAANRRGLVLFEETAGAAKKVYGQLTYH